MNWANRLTVSRFFLALIFVAAMSSGWKHGHTIALAVFLLAGITDYADGEIARRFSLITDFGKLMDPLMDKILIASAFICLIPFHAIPAWAVVVVVSREFAITGLRLLAISKGRVLAAESLGKHKTFWQITTVIFFLLMLSIREIKGYETTGPAPHWFGTTWNYAGDVFIFAAVALTLVSGIGYLWKNHGVIEME
ncbi:MAG: CDP-diacylglycerol--glycerol-3-phosphate 3-phosphatidyltransferase [Verrucomicrobiota bacterium]